MNIIQVIRQANQQGPIYFLLTAYVESVWHTPAPRGIPGWVLELPIRGRTDIQARFVALTQLPEPPNGIPEDDDREKISEALAVLSTASQRLAALENVGIVQTPLHEENLVDLFGVTPTTSAS